MIETSHLQIARDALREKVDALEKERDKAAKAVREYTNVGDWLALGREHYEAFEAAATERYREALFALDALGNRLESLERKVKKAPSSVTLAFTMSMPGRNSWNGRWSGEDKVYALVRTFRGKDVPAAQALVAKDYLYRWDDGWCAGVTVTEVTSAEAAKLRRKSAGFCGYDWMVGSIVRHGRITTDHDLAKEASCAT
jgi:hypothetical protein